MKLLILENEPAHAGELLRLLEGYPARARFEVACFARASALREHLAAGQDADVLLADIALDRDEEDGIEAVRALFPPGSGTQVIYVTGYAEYCTKVYETEHIYFLLKPVKPQELYAALDRALARLDEAAARRITVRVGSDLIRIYPHAIRYIESDRRKVRIHTTSGVVEAYASLAALHMKLKAGFCQCHKSFLVNLAHVAQLQGERFVLTGGAEVPISQKRAKAARSAFLHYLGDRL